MTESHEQGAPRFYLEIFVISFAALLLEISYTRLISFKFFYYYTYLIIGFALLGIGSGGVLVAISPRLRRVPLTRFLASGCLAGAAAVGVGYWIVARTPTDAFKLTRNIANLGELLPQLTNFLLVCMALFGTFLAVGMMVSVLFSARAENIHRLYFADLVGAGLACAVVVPLIGLLGPPSCIALGGLVLAATGASLAYRRYRGVFWASLVAAGLLGIGVVYPGALPDLVTDATKTIDPSREDQSHVLFSRWSPVFRIDVTKAPLRTDDNLRMIHHDGLLGSSLHRWDGDPASLGRFDTDVRAFPFKTVWPTPKKVLIIGAAGGHEILASLHFGADSITAVELNPVTRSLLTTVFPEYSGNLHQNPRVNLVNAEGRSFLARDDTKYDLIYFVAPDSYSAMNAATAGAFVLSESYLYTTEMIVESLQHLTDEGVICMQFGEYTYKHKPNRTARYVGTARQAFGRLGITDVARHIVVATSPGILQLSTVLLKRTPFSEQDVQRFMATSRRVEGSVPRHAIGRDLDDGAVNKIVTLDDAGLDRWYETYRYDVRPIYDDAPFFWHFARFRTVIAELRTPLVVDAEDSIGERLLLVMVGVSALFAGFFLLLPFVTVRDVWGQLPLKGRTAAFFAALGLGFMFYEISLIQQLTLFLGYPTYSLTVTLMSILIFTGVGSLTTVLYAERRNQALGALFAGLVLMTVFYRFGMPAVAAAFLGSSLAVRVTITILCLAPLGLILGAFMPLGLAAVSRLTVHSAEYVAWGWAVNGFFSVIGSVLTTILSMTFGFQAVLSLGLVVYGVACLLLRTVPIGRPAGGHTG